MILPLKHIVPPEQWGKYKRSRIYDSTISFTAQRNRSINSRLFVVHCGDDCVVADRKQFFIDGI